MTNAGSHIFRFTSTSIGICSLKVDFVEARLGRRRRPARHHFAQIVGRRDAPARCDRSACSSIKARYIKVQQTMLWPSLQHGSRYKLRPATSVNTPNLAVR